MAKEIKIGDSTVVADISDDCKIILIRVKLASEMTTIQELSEIINRYLIMAEFNGVEKSDGSYIH